MSMSRILRRPEVELRVGFKKSLIYQLMKENKFPRSVKMGGAVGWLEHEIDAFIAARAAERWASAPGETGDQGGDLRKAS